MPKLRHKKKFTRLTQALYRDKVYYLEQPVVGYTEVTAEMEDSEPIYGDLQAVPISYAQQRASDVPPTGETRAALKKAITVQRRQRRLVGKYNRLPERDGLVQLGWLHRDVRFEIDDTPTELYRDFSWLVKRGFEGEGRYKLRMAGTRDFIHPEGSAQKAMDQEVRKTVPDWVQRLRAEEVTGERNDNNEDRDTLF